MVTPSRPSDAERARTVVACARLGTLRTYPARPPAAARTTIVSIDTDDAGRPVARLRQDSPAVRDLVARPLATLAMAHGGGSGMVMIQGSARLLSGRGDGVHLAYRIEIGTVRLHGPDGGSIPPEEYRRAEPDPLREQAPHVLAHLAARHVHDLTACLRAHGLVDLAWAEPLALDRYGLELLAVDEDGACRVRLPFPSPLGHPGELDSGLQALLFCRCRTRPPGPAARP